MFYKSLKRSRIGVLWKLVTFLFTLSLMTLLISTYLECKVTRILISPKRNFAHVEDAAILSEWKANKKVPSRQSVNLTSQKRVVIGAVSCRNVNDSMKYNEETLVMLKSVLISARLYEISDVEVYLFLEYKEDENYFSMNLGNMTNPNDLVKLHLIFLSAVDIVPAKYRSHMIYHPRYRCGYTRFFFPSALSQVDSIVHLDSDMIITGNLWKIWKQFYEFEGEQMIGAARSNEPHDTHYLKMHRKWFGDIPHPPPRGINAGLLLMNLTKMRKYGWEQRFLRTFDDYSKLVNLTGQRTVSVMLGNDPGILKMLSCQLNFCHRHCDKGFSCFDTVQEGASGGIHLVHGNNFEMEKGGDFEGLFKAYKEFNMTVLKSLKSQDRQVLIKTISDLLMLPIRRLYSQPNRSKCHGTLNHVLFREFFNDTTVYSLNS